MSHQRWEQMKRYLNISNLINDQNLDTRDSDWLKKLKSLIIDFRNASKNYWIFESHVSIDEQLIQFRERFAHAIMFTCKAAEVSFKLYNIR
jgi:chemotaxis regulatin CheY-phosphate phosphatase CheZ